MIIERDIEQRLKSRVESNHGLCIKMDASSYGGIPDRLVILPANTHGPLSTPRYIWVELKRPKGGRVSAQQAVWRSRLQLLGAEHRIIRTYGDIEKMIGEMTDGNKTD